MEEYSIEQLADIFEFILSSDDIDISDSSIFNKSFLRKFLIINYSKDFDEIVHCDYITEEHKKIIINSFLNNEQAICSKTPCFILNNIDCIKKSLDIDIDSVQFLSNVEKEQEEFVLKYFIDNKICFKKSYPAYIKSNVEIIKNSICTDVNIADYIIWEGIKESDAIELVDEIIKLGYVLKDNSCTYLKKCTKVILVSIDKDINLIEYADSGCYAIKEVFNLLVDKGFKFNFHDLSEIPLFNVDNLGVFQMIINELSTTSDSNYIKNMSKMLFDASNVIPKISDLKDFFNYIALEEWEDAIDPSHENLFGKICTQLRNYDDFLNALSSFDFLDYLEELEDDYSLMREAMQKYFDIYHSDMDNKYLLLEEPKNTISKFCALLKAKEKEKFKKEEVSFLEDLVKPFFSLRLDNELVYKKIIYTEKRKVYKTKYHDEIINEDGEIYNFLESLISKYSDSVSSETLRLIVSRFIVYGISKLELILPPPNCYQDYQLYEKCTKIVNRLNNNYIKYDGKDVDKYRNYIRYSSLDNKYYIIDLNFTSEDIEQYNEYNNIKRIFNELKRLISEHIDTMTIDDKIEIDDISEEQIPFTDEYYVFNESKVKNDIDFGIIYKRFLANEKYSKSNIANQETFNVIYDIFVNRNFFWIVMFNEFITTSKLLDHIIIPTKKAIENIHKIIDLSKTIKYSAKSFFDILLLSKIGEYTSKTDIGVIGLDVLCEICKSNNYLDENLCEIIPRATSLIYLMSKKNKSSIPYISGSTLNYKYSLYDAFDYDIIFSGHRTDSCFRLDGFDNDFLCYSMLSKNGFAIKITDSYDNFIGRAAGFRNGNCVFINQLRTIYDESGNLYYGQYENETKDIKEALKKACDDMIAMSSKHEEKIEYVFITKSYIYDNSNDIVNSDVVDAIGNFPVNKDCDDWNLFVRTPYLDETRNIDCFHLDYGDYPVVLISGIKKVNEITSDDLIKSSVEAIYERKRNKIVVTDTVDKSLEIKINRIRFMKAYSESRSGEYILIPTDSIICIGDNWYIIVNNNTIYSSCVLDYDSNAVLEYEATKKVIEEQSIFDLNMLSSKLNNKKLIFKK